MKNYEKPLAEIIIFQTMEAIMNLDLGDEDVDIGISVPDEL